jgi:hypothetical protein
MAGGTPAVAAEEISAGDADSVFVPEGDGRFTPTEHARGPWDPRALHGGATAALIAAAFERMHPDSELQFARLSFSFLRPIPLAPLQLSTRVVRPGRRVLELEAELIAVGDGDGATGGPANGPASEPAGRSAGRPAGATSRPAGGELVGRASALRILPAPAELPELALALAEEHDGPALPGPEEGHEVRFALDDVDRKSFAATAMQMRFLRGRPLKGGLPDVGISSSHAPTGTAQVWMRLTRQLLPGETPSPLVQVIAAADFGNGVSAVLPFDEYVFINADLSIALNRRPVGEWIALDARTLLHPGGIAWAESVLHDERGPLGLATQSLVVQPR